MHFVLGDQSDLRTQPGELTRDVLIQHKVFVQAHTPVLKSFVESIIIRGGVPKLYGRIQKEHRSSAALDILLQRIHNDLLVIALGAGDDHNRAVRGNLSLFEQADRFGLVVILAQIFLEFRIPVLRVAIVDLAFTVPGEKAKSARLVFNVANDRACDVSLSQALGFFFLGPDLHHRRAVFGDPCRAGLFRLLVGIDVFDADAAGDGRIAVEQILARLEIALLVVIGDGGGLSQPLYNLHGLVGETELLVRSGVIRLVVAIGKYVGHRDNGQDDQNVDRRVRRVLGLSRLDPTAIHLRPPTQRFHRARGEK